MNSHFLYFSIALIASVVGAISGIGGGVIIKPALDLFSTYDVGTISLISSVTVLSMAAAATIKHWLYRTKFEIRTGVFLALGAVFGGLFGNLLLDTAIANIVNQQVVKGIQSGGLALLLLFVLIYMNKLRWYKTFLIKNWVLTLFIGFCLGTVSTFLGIGGGPINVAILTLFFSMDTKKAAVNSILLILFSQSAKVLNVMASGSFHDLDLTLLLFMIPAGILGGIIGSRIGRHLPEKNVVAVFNTVLIFIIGINIFNIIKWL